MNTQITTQVSQILRIEERGVTRVWDIVKCVTYNKVSKAQLKKLRKLGTVVTYQSGTATVIKLIIDETEEEE